MEHVIQIAVGVDDERIAKICEEAAAKQVIEDIRMAAHGKKYYGGINDEPENLKELFKEEIEKCVEENKDKIIQLAVAEVSRGILRTKALKEAVGDLVDEIKEV